MNGPQLHRAIAQIHYTEDNLKIGISRRNNRLGGYNYLAEADVMLVLRALDELLHLETAHVAQTLRE